VSILSGVARVRKKVARLSARAGVFTDFAACWDLAAGGVQIRVAGLAIISQMIVSTAKKAGKPQANQIR